MGTLRTKKENNLIVVRGGGDLATGVIQKLWRAGFRVVVLESPHPMAIRRTVSLCSAVWEGHFMVEDVPAILAKDVAELPELWAKNAVPVLVDTSTKTIEQLCPVAVVDAILAKTNLGTHRGLAPITIALGPGFSAPDEVDCVVETMRGHSLGRLIFDGKPLPNTGIPGELGGKTAQRVVHAPIGGKVLHSHSIGDPVEQGEVLFYIDSTPVPSPLTGVLRGLIAEGTLISKGLKIADVDPRPKESVDYRTISDKARCLGGAVLEAVLYVARSKGISVFPSC